MKFLLSQHMFFWSINLIQKEYVKIENFLGGGGGGGGGGGACPQTPLAFRASKKHGSLFPPPQLKILYETLTMIYDFFLCILKSNRAVFGLLISFLLEV